MVGKLSSESVHIELIFGIKIRHMFTISLGHSLNLAELHSLINPSHNVQVCPLTAGILVKGDRVCEERMARKAQRRASVVA